MVIMNIFPGSETLGHIVNLKTTNPLHFGEKRTKPLNDDVSTSFADALQKAVSKVNNLQTDADDLAQKMIYNPESVDIHNVMIAAQKAEIALTFTKSVRDEAVKAYRELINLR